MLPTAVTVIPLKPSGTCLTSTNNPGYKPSTLQHH